MITRDESNIYKNMKVSFQYILFQPIRGKR
jgi:hypothetical protein